MARLLAILGLLALTTTAAGCQRADIADPAGISAQEIAQHVSILAHDSLLGRGAGAGLDAAARYVAGELKRLKLQPLGSDYQSTFRHELRRLRPSDVVLRINDRTQPYRYGTDFIAMYGSVPAGEGELIVMTSEEVAAADVTERLRGKVLVAIMPAGAHGAQRFAALQLARSAGAAALVLGHSEGIESELASQRARFEGALRINDTGDLIPHLYAGPALTRALRDAFEAGAARIRIEAPWQTLDPGITPNVAAILPGNDAAAAHERIILVAHLDHLGVRTPPAAGGDSIYNGADDNASGVAALLEIAEALALDSAGTRRSVVFLFAGGEESGKLGAGHFVRNPDFKADSVAAVINLDMIGRNAPDEIRLVAADLSTLGATAITLLRDEHGIHGLKGVLETDAGLVSRSDHYEFARKGIPSLWLFSGLHDDYHEPSDEIERLDVSKVARVASFTLSLVRHVSAQRTRPELTDAGRAIMQP